MNKIMFLDVETLPADESARETLEYLYQKKLEKKKKRKEMTDDVVYEEKPSDFDDYVRGTSFDGGFGRILCISYAIDYGLAQTLCNPNNEKEVLQKFWGIAKDINLFVGHNVIDFDMRFIYQRSVVLGVRPTKNLSFARYKDYPMYDTMREWGKWAFNNNVGLEHLALSLGVPTPKGEMEGPMVYDAYKAGKIKEICDYCERDVEATRAIYKKMNFL